MTHSGPERATTRRIPGILVAGLVVVIAAIAAALGYPLLASSSSTAASPRDLHARIGSTGEGAARLERIVRDPTPGKRAPVAFGQHPRLRTEHRGALVEADGFVSDGASVFDDETPAVANLDPSLLKALRQAATDAAKDGVEFRVTSGWRSAEYQEQLVRKAVSEYGSEGEAARWVATANKSTHVSGDAVDIGHVDATAWLSEHGARYGLCQIYRNEPWHYELRPEAIRRGCPPMYADPTHDPRMQQ
jgi:zinc D-Ala-D-Ala carboxypeptidase